MNNAASVLIEIVRRAGIGFAVDQKGSLYRFEPAFDLDPMAAEVWRKIRWSERLRYAVACEVRQRIDLGIQPILPPTPLLNELGVSINDLPPMALRSATD